MKITYYIRILFNKGIMKFNFLIIIFLSTYKVVFSQVGINTNQPKATLHVEPSSVATPNGTDGILIPKIANFPTLITNRIGKIVFLQGNSTNPDGFYYWNGSRWLGFPTIVNKDTDETIYSFQGQGYAGSDLKRVINFTKFIKGNKDNFSVSNNEITIGKSGLYLISLTANSKRSSASTTGTQANFNYAVLVNGNATASVSTSISAEPTSSTSATLDFLYKLEAGQKITAVVEKTTDNIMPYESFGINSLTLYFIQN